MVREQSCSILARARRLLLRPRKKRACLLIWRRKRLTALLIWARKLGVSVWIVPRKQRGFRFNQGWLTVLVALAIDNALSQLATDWERCNLQVMAAVISMLLVPYLCALLSRRMRN